MAFEIRSAWRGFSDDTYFDQVVHMGPEDTGISVGTRRGVLVEDLIRRHATLPSRVGLRADGRG